MLDKDLTKAQKLTLIYRHTHKDYKGNHPELGKTVLVLRGATCLVPLDQLTEEEIADKLPYSLKKEVERLEKLAAKKKAQPAQADGADVASVPAKPALHLVYKYTTGRVPNDGSGRKHKVSVYRVEPGKEMELLIKRTDNYVSEWQIARDAIKAAKIMPPEAFRADGELKSQMELKDEGIAIVESI